MPADQPPGLEPWMTEALVSALRAVGCPREIAGRLAREARLEPTADAPEERLLLLLSGHGHGVGIQIEREHWEQVVWSVAQNVAADNAEAHDRAARGEPGWTPLWPLPDRPPSRG